MIPSLSRQMDRRSEKSLTVTVTEDPLIVCRWGVRKGAQFHCRKLRKGNTKKIMSKDRPDQQHATYHMCTLTKGFNSSYSIRKAITYRFRQFQHSPFSDQCGRCVINSKWPNEGTTTRTAGQTWETFSWPGCIKNQGIPPTVYIIFYVCTLDMAWIFMKVTSSWSIFHPGNVWVSWQLTAIPPHN